MGFLLGVFSGCLKVIKSIYLLFYGLIILLTTFYSAAEIGAYGSKYLQQMALKGTRHNWPVLEWFVAVWKVCALPAV